jgi:LacI family transcriptional regulator
MNGEPSKAGVTLRDIAKSLGVSHVTVSLALRNAPQISEARRRQIHEAALKMGYRPNPMAAALGHMRSTGNAQPVTAELAWINHWEKPKDSHLSKEFELYWKGAHETAARHGYSLEEFICDRNLTLARLEKVLLARNIRGILIPPHHPLPAGWDDFPWQKFSVIRLGHSVDRPRVHLVTGDETGNSVLAFEKIRGLGYRRIGFVTSQADRPRFAAAFLTAQLDLTEDEQVPMLVFSTGDDNPGDQKKLVQWIRKNKPDALLTDRGAMVKMLNAAGYRVPQEMSVATLSIHDGNVDAGIDQNPEEIGKAAVEMLISEINHNEVGTPKVCRELLIKGQWIDGTMMAPRLNADRPAPG